VAGDQYWAGTDGVNLGAATLLAVLAINGTTGGRRAWVNTLTVSFTGITGANTPVDVRIQRVTNAPAGTALTTNFGPNPLDPNAPASTFTALRPSTATPGVWTTPPTLGAVAWNLEIPPTSGVAYQYPLGNEIVCSNGTTSGLAVVCNAPQPVAVWASLTWTE
jgi:hypothetical protein